MKRIDALDKRVENAELKFKDIEKEFDKLVDDYARINDLLRESNTPMQELYLFRAYLQGPVNPPGMISLSGRGAKNRVS